MTDNVIPKVALTTLAEQHLRTLCDTVQYVLSTQRAEYVFAQVAEGIPTKETARYKLHGLDPQIKDRVEPGPAALKLVRSWRSDFRLETFEIDANVSNLRPYITIAYLMYTDIASLPKQSPHNKGV